MQVLPSTDLVGRKVGRYSVVAFIRGGSQGSVYRGRDELLRRDVAIKAVNLDKAAERSPGALLAEAQVLSSLTHANVAGVYDFVTDNERDYIVMELVPGPTLGDMLVAGPLSMTAVVRLGSQLARGLAAIHSANIAHCDIKPANLKITASGFLKIVDFGVARRLVRGVLLRDPAASAPLVTGTFPYMAPEVLRGEGGDGRSDIFSAGAVLYELATAWRAFPQRSLPELKDAINNGRIVVPSRVNPLVPASLDRIVIKALQKVAPDRYRTATALAEAIEAVTMKQSCTSRPPMLSARPRFRKFRTTVAMSC